MRDIEVLHRLEELSIEVKDVLTAGDYSDVTVHNDRGSSVVLYVYSEGLAIRPSDMRSPAYFRWSNNTPVMNDVFSKDTFKYFHKNDLETVLNHLKRMLT